MNIKSVVKHRIYSSLFPSKHNIQLDSAVISFSFDDVPRSGAINGANLLEKYGLKGTFYFSMGMATPTTIAPPNSTIFKLENKLLFSTESDIQRLSENGHGIACHSYSHRQQSKQSIDFTLNDCKKNRDALSSITNDDIEHYSYPFGSINLFAKRRLRRQYKTMRSITPGINHGRTDMSCLKSVSIASNQLKKDHALKLIDQAVKKKAWLIFFTHEVCEQPNPWGTTLEDFEWVIKASLEKRCHVKPVHEVYSILQQRSA